MKRAIPILVVVLVASIPGIAWATWVTGGSGTGRAKGGTLPTGPTPSSTIITSSTITLTWSDVTLGGQPLSTLTGGRYVVSRNGGASSVGCGGASGIAGTTCVESGLSPATTYTFTIAAKLGNWVGNDGTSISRTTLSAPTITFPTASAQEVVTHNQTASFTVTGTAFQSGATVAISGGFTITGVTYVDVSHITVNVTALGGAFKGVYDLTVTNPDGGTRTSTGSMKNA